MIALVVIVLGALLFVLGYILRVMKDRGHYAAATVIFTMQLIIVRAMILRIHGEDPDVPYLLTLPENNWLFIFLSNGWCFLALYIAQLAAVVNLTDYLVRRAPAEN